MWLQRAGKSISEPSHMKRYPSKLKTTQQSKHYVMWLEFFSSQRGTNSETTLKFSNISCYILSVQFAKMHRKSSRCVPKPLLTPTVRRAPPVPSSETQGLLVGTMRYFRAKVYLKRGKGERPWDRGLVEFWLARHSPKYAYSIDANNYTYIFSIFF